MKTSLLSCALALLSSAFLHADLVMVQSIEGGGLGQNGEMTVKMKGNKLRIDISKEASVMTDTESGDMTTLMHSQKVYMQVSGAMTAQMLKNAAAQSGKSGNEKVTLQPTGKKETVNGYETEIYTTVVGDQKATYWIAKDYPEGAKFLDFFKKMQGSALSKMAREAAPQPEDFPGVPVKTQVEMGAGQKVTTTLMSLKDEPVNDSEFAVPAGYKAMSMPTMPGAGE